MKCKWMHLISAGLFFIYTFFSSQAQDNYSWYTNYDVKWYKININANDTSASINGYTTILCEIKSTFSDTFYFELAQNVHIDSVVIQGTNKQFVRLNEVVAVPVLNKIKTGNLLEVQIYYESENKESGFFSTFTNRKDTEWKIPVTWTLSEPFGAKSWFPCKQELTDKADSSMVIITVPKNLKAGSNGLLIKVEPINEKYIRYIWRSKYPIAYYLLSFAVAEYNEYSFYAPINNSDSVLVQNYYYNRPGYLEKNRSKIEYTSKFLRLYSDLFGDYPFKDEKYGHCLAPLGGGMEHQTMTTLSNFGFDLVSHELAHQWFGNLVTCSNWQDIWINEGFASYAEYLAREFLDNEKAAQDWLNYSFGYSFYYPSGSLYIPSKFSKNEDRIFNYGISYKKGASVIHALRNEINHDSTFFVVVKEFLKTYAFKNAGAKEFIEILNKNTGIDYNWFFDQWYYGEGFPELEILWKNNNDSIHVMAVQKHSAKGAQPFKFHFNMRLVSVNDSLETKKDTTLRVYMDNWSQNYTFPFPNKKANLECNPKNKSYLKLNHVNQTIDFPTNDNEFSCNLSFKDSLVITFDKKDTYNGKMVICSLDGNQLLERKLKNNKTLTIDTQWFEKGNYLLYFWIGKNRYIRIINKK